MRDVTHNKLSMLLESMKQQGASIYTISILTTILREEEERGFQDGDRDMKNNVIVYTLSPDAMPADCQSEADLVNICKNVAGSPDVINAVNAAITEAATFQREDISHNRTTNKRFVIQDFERECANLTGKEYPADFTPEFIHAMAVCDREFLEMIAHDSMNSSDEILNGPRAEYLYKRCLSNGGKQTLFAPYLLAEVVQVVAANDAKLNSISDNEVRKDMKMAMSGHVHFGQDFETVIEMLSGKTYPQEYSNEFIIAKANCSQQWLDEIAAPAEDLQDFDYSEAKRFIETELSNRPQGAILLPLFSAEVTI